jgi:hypothetical protein
MVGMN